MKMRAPFRYWGAKALGREGWGLDAKDWSAA